MAEGRTHGHRPDEHADAPIRERLRTVEERIDIPDGLDLRKDEMQGWSGRRRRTAALRCQSAGVGPRSAANTDAAPRKKANAVAAMRSTRIGMRSATRERAISSMRERGSGRSGAAAHSPWTPKGTLTRAALPFAARYPTVRCRMPDWSADSWLTATS